MIAVTATDIHTAIIAALTAFNLGVVRALWRLHTRLTRIEALDESTRHPRHDEREED